MTRTTTRTDPEEKGERVDGRTDADHEEKRREENGWREEGKHVTTADRQGSINLSLRVRARNEDSYAVCSQSHFGIWIIMPALWQLIKYEAKYRSLLGALALLAHFKSPTPRTSRCVYHLGKVGGAARHDVVYLKSISPL